MTDPVQQLTDSIDRMDVPGIRAAYAEDARLLAMTPNTFQVHDGPEAIAAKLGEWFASWGEDPSYSFLGLVREGDRAVVEFERVNTYEGETWVARQSHTLELGPEGIVTHRMYCCGPRAGTPELAEGLAARAPKPAPAGEAAVR